MLKYRRKVIMKKVLSLLLSVAMIISSFPAIGQKNEVKADTTAKTLEEMAAGATLVEGSINHEVTLSAADLYVDNEGYTELGKAYKLEAKAGDMYKLMFMPDFDTAIDIFKIMEDGSYLSYDHIDSDITDDRGECKMYMFEEDGTYLIIVRPLDPETINGIYNPGGTVVIRKTNYMTVEEAIQAATVMTEDTYKVTHTITEDAYIKPDSTSEFDSGRFIAVDLKAGECLTIKADISTKSNNGSGTMIIYDSNGTIVSGYPGNGGGYKTYEATADGRYYIFAGADECFEGEICEIAVLRSEELAKSYYELVNSSGATELNLSDTTPTEIIIPDKNTTGAMHSPCMDTMSYVSCMTYKITVGPGEYIIFDKSKLKKHGCMLRAIFGDYYENVELGKLPSICYINGTYTSMELFLTLINESEEIDSGSLGISKGKVATGDELKASAEDITALPFNKTVDLSGSEGFVTDINDISRKALLFKVDTATLGNMLEYKINSTVETKNLYFTLYDSNMNVLYETKNINGKLALEENKVFYFCVNEIINSENAEFEFVLDRPQYNTVEELCQKAETVTRGETNKTTLKINPEEYESLYIEDDFYYGKAYKLELKKDELVNIYSSIGGNYVVDTDGKITFTWDFRAEKDGTYYILNVLYDKAGNYIDLQIIEHTYDFKDRLTIPVNGHTDKEDTTFEYSGTDKDIFYLIDAADETVCLYGKAYSVVGKKDQYLTAFNYYGVYAVYDSKGNVLYRCDDSSMCPESVSVKLPEDGTYYVIVGKDTVMLSASSGVAKLLLTAEELKPATEHLTDASEIAKDKQKETITLKNEFLSNDMIYTYSAAYKISLKSDELVYIKAPDAKDVVYEVYYEGIGEYYEEDYTDYTHIAERDGIDLCLQNQNYDEYWLVIKSKTPFEYEATIERVDATAGIDLTAIASTGASGAGENLWSYDETNKILTLKDGFSLTTGEQYGIRVPDGVTIVVEGKATINVGYFDGYGIRGTDDLNITLKEGAVLDINALNGRGIRVSGNLSISGQADATTKPIINIKSCQNYGLQVNDDLMMSDVEINIKADDDALHAVDNAVIENCKGTMMSCDEAIELTSTSDEKAIIRNCDFYIDTNFVDGNEGFEVYNLEIIDSTITIYSDNEGIECDEKLVIDNSEITVTSNTEDGFIGDIIEIRNSTIKITSDEEGIDVYESLILENCDIFVRAKNECLESGGNMDIVNTKLDLETYDDPDGVMFIEGKLNADFDIPYFLYDEDGKLLYKGMIDSINDYMEHYYYDDSYYIENYYYISYKGTTVHKLRYGYEVVYEDADGNQIGETQYLLPEEEPTAPELSAVDNVEGKVFLRWEMVKNNITGGMVMVPVYGEKPTEEETTDNNGSGNGNGGSSTDDNGNVTSPDTGDAGKVMIPICIALAMVGGVVATAMKKREEV